MRDGFKQLIIGFLFVLIKIHVVVDLLPDFLGYIFIYNGIKQIATLSSQSYEKLKILSIILVIASIPNFFLNDQVIQQSGWFSYYPIFLSLLKVILVYFLFDLLRGVAKLLPSNDALQATNRMYTWYLTIVLGSLFFQSLLMNFPINIAFSAMIFIVISVLVIEISFLFYLRNMQKRFPSGGLFNVYS
ncbi:hypothetical protein PB01_17980 [Psychrobacillus glaciei]|uniref:Uncharacterized protein n=1 Tax=Psychrobacillus glaciei TaxID=2283160 RepID=A0A5J6SU53_9BACI|nr:hypothetical protein [Psychrobacillus glaciei]QFG00525.1 hypothetical protein PB01_17980 [Psychrobacillus glaciei]